MSVITIPAKVPRQPRAAKRQPQQLTLDQLDDTPCRPGKIPLWPGGPCLPAWVEQEALSDRATPAQLGYLKTLGIDYRPRDKYQAAQWIDLAREWKKRVP